MCHHRAAYRAAALVGALALASAAAAQPFTMDWSSISNSGGTTIPVQGGSFRASGTIGQPFSGLVSGGTFNCGSGFWGGAGGPPPCYANCDGSTIPPTLNVSDFICFQQKYAAADPYANCDGSTIPPTLNVSDFICFQQKYAAGCP
jgi:hypothetical protein